MEPAKYLPWDPRKCLEATPTLEFVLLRFGHVRRQASVAVYFLPLSLFTPKSEEAHVGHMKHMSYLDLLLL